MKRKFILSFLTVYFYSFLSAQIPVNGLIARYPFNGNANDISGYGHNGTVVSATLTTDRFGNPNSAYQFDGVNSYITVNSPFFNIGNTAYTISCWVNSSMFSSPYNIVNSQVYFNTIPHNGLGITFSYKNHSNKYLFSANSNPSPGAVTWNMFLNQQTNTSTTINVWNNFVMTKQGTVFTIYINGQLDGSYTAATVPANYNCGIVIGGIDPAITTTQGERFIGKLDDYFIYDRALTVAEIQALYKDTYILPLQMISLDANFNHSQLSVNWETSNEINMSKFIIEGSNDGQAFTTLGEVTAKNNQQDNYTFTNTLVSDLRFVRLKMEDIDGSLTYSKTIAISGMLERQSFTLAPNPVRATTTLFFKESVSSAEISVLNMIGKKVYSSSFQGSLRSQYFLSIPALPAGAYIVNVKTEKSSLRQTILVL